MAAHEEDLLAVVCFDRAHGIIGQAEGDAGAIGRPARAVGGVEADDFGKDEFVLHQIPNLNLPHASREPASDGELFAVGGKAGRLDALGEADEPLHQSGAIGLVDEDLVKARYRDERAVGRVIERGEIRENGVARGGRLGVTLPGILRGIVGGTLLDPLFHERDLVVGEWLLLRRHLGTFLARLGHDEFEQVTFIGLPRDNRGAVLATGDEPGDFGHDVVGFRLGWLVTSLALCLKDRANVLIVTHFFGHRVAFRLGCVGREGDDDEGKR